MLRAFACGPKMYPEGNWCGSAGHEIIYQSDEDEVIQAKAKGLLHDHQWRLVRWVLKCNETTQQWPLLCVSGSELDCLWLLYIWPIAKPQVTGTLEDQTRTLRLPAEVCTCFSARAILAPAPRSPPVHNYATKDRFAGPCNHTSVGLLKLGDIQYYLLTLGHTLC